MFRGNLSYNRWYEVKLSSSALQLTRCLRPVVPPMTLTPPSVTRWEARTKVQAMSTAFGDGLSLMIAFDENAKTVEACAPRPITPCHASLGRGQEYIRFCRRRVCIPRPSQIHSLEAGLRAHGKPCNAHRGTHPRDKITWHVALPRRHTWASCHARRR